MFIELVCYAPGMILDAENIVANPESLRLLGEEKASKREQTATSCQAKLRAMKTNSTNQRERWFGALGGLRRPLWGGYSTAETRMGWGNQVLWISGLPFSASPQVWSASNEYSTWLKQKGAGGGPCSPSCLSSPLTITMPCRPGEKSVALRVNISRKLFNSLQSASSLKTQTIGNKADSTCWNCNKQYLQVTALEEAHLQWLTFDTDRCCLGL